jgi:hypothetical protein
VFSGQEAFEGLGMFVFVPFINRKFGALDFYQE